MKKCLSILSVLLLTVSSFATLSDGHFSFPAQTAVIGAQTIVVGPGADGTYAIGINISQPSFSGSGSQDTICAKLRWTDELGRAQSTSGSTGPYANICPSGVAPGTRQFTLRIKQGQAVTIETMCQNIVGCTVGGGSYNLFGTTLGYW